MEKKRSSEEKIKKIQELGIFENSESSRSGRLTQMKAPQMKAPQRCTILLEWNRIVGQLREEI